MKEITKWEKKQIIEDFQKHVSSGKAATFKKYGMEFVIGDRGGPYIWDVTGKKKLINCHSNGGVFNLGHSHPEIITALVSSLGQYDIGNHHFISEMRAKLGAKLADLMPKDLNYTVFGVSGGESVDLAIKLARAYTERQGIVSVQGGYHGHTGLALATGDVQYREPFGELAPGFHQVPFNDIQAMEKAVDNKTAAVILETIPATLGIAIPEKSYLKKVREICDRNDSLLILDEVQSGLGRTGKLWAFEYYKVIPDIVVIGKGLSGGIYPITATVFREPLESFFFKNPFIHVSTFGGSELGCVVALKVLELSSDPAFLEHVNHIAKLLQKGFDTLQKKHSKQIAGFRQMGMMAGIVFKEEKMGPLFTKAAYESGLLCIYSNNDKRVCQLLPPLIITENHVYEIIEKIDKAVSRLKFYKTVWRVIGSFKKKDS
ncbi:MAG: aspartate aminotransferase family protein [Bacteroidetes bacterium]|nr:aspartate aminotransferase family protein [Bacteroidota bacterium]